MSLEALGGAGLREILSGENQNHVPQFVTQGHSVGEGVSQRGPTQVEPEGLIDISSGSVEGLVSKRLDHAQHLRLSNCARQFCN